ncbi:hypothetical protein Plec18167_007822 [Paecilomyces lecythidis]|uniref:Uncharacterized protein n=1 Tax=Paecilomyces lecythidis TaxID=3004212 RepID=A0ABR3X1M4_9EURO
MARSKSQASSDPDYISSDDTSKEVRDAEQEEKKQSPRRKRKPKTKLLLKKEGVQARKNLKSAKEDIAKLESENRALRAALRKNSTPDYVVDDLAIQKKFQDLTDNAYRWTRMNSCDSHASDEVVRYLKEHKLISSPEWLNCSDEDLSEMACLPFSCNIFLNALVIKVIYENFILSPFATLHERISQGRGAVDENDTLSKIPPMLQRLADKFNESDRYGTAEWISLTLKKAYPPKDTNIDHGHPCLEAFYKHVADKFYSELANCLIKKDISPQASKEGLIWIFRKANELRIDIWKHSMDIQAHLLGSRTLGKGLNAESNFMQVHCTVLENTAPEARLRMAITPAVAAYWLDSAGNEQSKVWAKAVVWAGSPKEWEINKDLDACMDDAPNEGLHEELQESNRDSATDTKKDQPTATLSVVKAESIEPSEISTISPAKNGLQVLISPLDAETLDTVELER